MKLLSRKTTKEREKNWQHALNRFIKEYIKNGCIGDLNFYFTPKIKLPNNLTQINGNLLIYYADDIKFPDTLTTINGNCHIHFSNVYSLPPNLTKINGFLGIYCSSIKKLPNNLTVNGYLAINNCSNMVELPDNLTIINHLNINDSVIDKIPSTTIVNGNIYSRRSILTKYEIHKMCQNIGGKVISNDI